MDKTCQPWYLCIHLPSHNLARDIQANSILARDRNQFETPGLV